MGNIFIYHRIYINFKSLSNTWWWNLFFEIYNLSSIWTLLFKGLGNFGEQEVGYIKQFVLMRTRSYEIVKRFFDNSCIAYKEIANIDKMSFEMIVA